MKIAATKSRSLLLAAGAMLAAGLALLLFSGGGRAAKAESGAQAQAGAADSALAYAEAMEARLTALLGDVAGAGEVTVMVTVACGSRYEYAADARQSADYDTDGQQTREESLLEQNVIVVQTENGDQPLLVTEELPQILGVAVICDGGDDIYVKQSMIEAVSILCGISSNRISVCRRAA